MIAVVSEYLHHLVLLSAHSADGKLFTGTPEPEPQEEHIDVEVDDDDVFMETTEAVSQAFTENPRSQSLSSLPKPKPEEQRPLRKVSKTHYIILQQHCITGLLIVVSVIMGYDVPSRKSFQAFVSTK